MAEGATPIATQNPTTVAEAIDIDAIRGRRDMSHLSRGQDAALTPALAGVTVVICVTIVTSDALNGMYP